MMAGDRRSFRHTKIVATMGPACAIPAVLRGMIDAGLDVVRINSSHGDAEVWARWIDLVRSVAAESGRFIGVLVDLQGPRIRVGSLAAPVELVEGSEVVFAPENAAGAGEIPTTYAALATDVASGARILLDDGLLAVEVTRTDGQRVHGVVRHGGVLASQKGINLPDVEVSAPAFTDRDRESLAVAVRHHADFVGISFVQRASDVEAVRGLVPPTMQLVAKIERAAAVEALPAILRVTDALMVARGDLGVELPFEEVPLTQKRIIGLASRRSRPVITATQMLESMVRNRRPTRAEASDVANAILDGTDAVMLSAETAVGAYPVEAVQAMARIIEEVEREAVHEGGSGRRVERRVRGRPRTVEEAIALATTSAAEFLDVPAIVCLTKSGFTAREIAAHRPSIPIVGFSSEETTCRCLSLVWGVRPMLVEHAPTYDAMVGLARDHLVEDGVVRPGDRIAITAGVPFDVPGTTNLLKIESI